MLPWSFQATANPFVVASEAARPLPGKARLAERLSKLGALWWQPSRLMSWTYSASWKLIHAEQSKCKAITCLQTMKQLKSLLFHPIMFTHQEDTSDVKSFSCQARCSPASSVLGIARSVLCGREKLKEQSPAAASFKRKRSRLAIAIKRSGTNVVLKGFKSAKCTGHNQCLERGFQVCSSEYSSL